MSDQKTAAAPLGSLCDATGHRQSGFTLLEILVVVAILSILLMIATPFYQNYSLQAKIGGELLLVDPVKKKVFEEYSINDNWPVSNTQAGAKEPTFYSGNYVLSVEVGNTPVDGSIVLTYNSAILPALMGQNTIVFYPSVQVNNVKWLCDRGTVPSKFRPARCR